MFFLQALRVIQLSQCPYWLGCWRRNTHSLLTNFNHYQWVWEKHRNERETYCTFCTWPDIAKVSFNWRSKTFFWWSKVLTVSCSNLCPITTGCWARTEAAPLSPQWFGLHLNKAKKTFVSFEIKVRKNIRSCFWIHFPFINGAKIFVTVLTNFRLFASYIHFFAIQQPIRKTILCFQEILSIFANSLLIHSQHNQAKQIYTVLMKLQSGQS